MKSLNLICKFRSTWNFLGVSSVSQKIFKIPIHGFILVALYRTLCHICYFFISVKFLRKDFPGQYISDFYCRSEYSKRPEIQKLRKNGTKSFTLRLNGTYHFGRRRFIIIIEAATGGVRSVRKGVLRNFAKFTGKHLWQSLFFNKVAGLRLAALLKKRLWHRYFPVNFAKFLRTPILQNTPGRLLLNYFVNDLHVLSNNR